ncbi:MAG: TldD/PmbA family protein [Proteobacteria bacterium]|nr:TldD/PmbA family protein [Pseudomonadota bacterium]
MEKIINVLRKRYKNFEIWREQKDMISLEENDDGIRKESHSKVEVAVRVFKDGIIGFGYISGEENIDDLIENVELSLKYSERDEYNTLPDPDYIDGTCFGKEKDVNVELLYKKMVEMKECLKEKQYLKSIERLSGNYEQRKISLFNSSRGVQEQIIQKYALGVVVVVKKEGDEKIEWDFEIDNDLENMDPKVIANKSYNRAVNLLNSSPTYTGEYTILFEPRASCDFLEVFAQSFIGENVYKKRSLLTDSINFSEKLTIYDNPMVQKGSISYFFDGEGFQGGNKKLVDRGKVDTILYDSFYGKKMGKKSTGNSIRSKISSPPRNWFSTVIIDKGDDDINTFIKGKRVIRVISLIGMHLVNTITGDFSVGFEGYLMEDGNYVKALSGVSIAGNLKDLYKNIVAVGNDLEIYGQAGSPSILVEGIVVSGI